MFILVNLIRAIQTLVGVKPDGAPGELTWKAIYAKLTGKEWEEPVLEVPDVDGLGDFPKEAVRLILEAEGVDQPSEWPGGSSGITIGFGCDIGADPASLEFWRGILTDDQIDRLSVAKGKTGMAARVIKTRFTDIKVTRADSLMVFMKSSLPREIELTKRTYKGIEGFPPQVLGAMVSVTYNRGGDLDRDESEGTRRLELRTIADIISAYHGQEEKTEADLNMAMTRICEQLTKSKRLWIGKDLDGLLTRRDNEVRLIRTAITS